MLYYALALFMFGCIVSGYRAYIAWFKPEQHQAYLEWWSRIYDGWAPSSKAWMKSRFSFWLMRFAFPLMFVIALAGFL